MPTMVIKKYLLQERMQICPSWFSSRSAIQLRNYSMEMLILQEVERKLVEEPIKPT